MVLKRALTASEASSLDEKIRQELNIPAFLLMENAGSAIAKAAARYLSRGRRGKAAVFCGKGNNAGDGFVAARHLLAAGFSAEVYLFAGNALSEEAGLNLEILRRLKVKIYKVTKGSLLLLEKRIRGYGLIIDALLGIGLKGEVRGLLKEAIRIINKSGRYVVCADIPSGLDTAAGRAFGECVKADITVTFFSCKRGMMVSPGKKLCGEVVVDNLGVPDKLIGKMLKKR